MTIQEMKRRKQELGYSNAKVAQLSGVPLGTVQKIFSGETTYPRYQTLQALEQVLGELSSAGTPFVNETTAPYLSKRQGDYTLDDYRAFPEDYHIELIDGVIYNMSAPLSAHQLIAGYIYAQFFNHIDRAQGDCLPMISPVDVQLDCDEKTMVQPDVIIVCDRSKVIKRCVYGTPDFVLEVLSPSTKKKDMIIKLNKYMSAGVREYWMIDPDKQAVTIYDFAHDEYPLICGFQDAAVVSVLDGKCQIDFADMYDYIHFLYEDEPSSTESQ